MRDPEAGRPHVSEAGGRSGLQSGARAVSSACFTWAHRSVSEGRQRVVRGHRNSGVVSRCCYLKCPHE